MKYKITECWKKFISLTESSNIKELTTGTGKRRWKIGIPNSVTGLQLESQLRDQPRMWTKETFSEVRKGFWWKSHRKKEKIVWGIKREDDCEGLVGFTKRIGAPTLFAAILFLLISLHPSFSECISPNSRTSYKRDFCIFLMSVGKKIPWGDFLMNTCWRHFMGSKKGLRGRCARMVTWSVVLRGQVGCFSHI